LRIKLVNTFKYRTYKLVKTYRPLVSVLDGR
jgi:hypothetical protein